MNIHFPLAYRNIMAILSSSTHSISDGSKRVVQHMFILLYIYTFLSMSSCICLLIFVPSMRAIAVNYIFFSSGVAFLLCILVTIVTLIAVTLYIWTFDQEPNKEMARATIRKMRKLVGFIAIWSLTGITLAYKWITRSLHGFYSDRINTHSCSIVPVEFRDHRISHLHHVLLLGQALPCEN